MPPRHDEASESAILQRWRSHMAKLKLEPCNPPFWARSSHLQTILGSYLPYPAMPAGGETVRIPLPDGDQLTGLVHSGTEPVVVYLFHGLCGSNQATYIRIAAHMARARGYHVIAANHRGCGDGVGLALGPYHSGRAEDLAEVIAWGRHRYPKYFHVAIGVSLSGNALLLLAADVRGHVPPDLAIAVNAPIKLEDSAIALKRGISKLYDLRFSVRCRQAVEERNAAGLTPPIATPRFCSLHDFDNYYTAPAGGFADREDYYHTCSAAVYVDRIRIPTVVLTSCDDPLIDYRDYLKAPFSPWAHLHLEDHGGHLGYLDRGKGNLRWLRYFLDTTISAAREVLDPAVMDGGSD